MYCSQTADLELGLGTTCEVKVVQESFSLGDLPTFEGHTGLEGDYVEESFVSSTVLGGSYVLLQVRKGSLHEEQRSVQQ